MRSFIAVAGSHDQQVVYLDPTTITFKKESVFVLPEGFSKVLKENLFV